MNALPAITKTEIQSVDFLSAFGKALYQMQKNARYRKWSPERRQRHALGVAFQAALDARTGKRQHPKMLQMTQEMIDMSVPDHD